MQRVDDPRAPAREPPLDGLRVLQVGVHARSLVHKPGAQVRGGVIGVLANLGDLVRRGQRGHRQAEPYHGAPVLHETTRIGHAVALDVGSLLFRRVGPPVIAFAEEIVLAPGAAWTAGRGDRDRRFAEILVGGPQHARPLDGGEIELGGGSGGAHGGQGERGGEERAASHTNASLARISRGSAHPGAH